MVTKEEIIQKSKLNDNEERKNLSGMKLKLFVNFFNKELDFLITNISSVESEPKMTFITKTINEVISKEFECPKIIKEEIYQHYRGCIENTSYGIVPNKGFENEVEANQAYFNVNTPDEAFDKLKILMVYINTETVENADNTSFKFLFEPPWDIEHDVSILVQNGNFIYFE